MQVTTEPSKSFSIHPVVLELLKKRGHEGPKGLQDFFSSDLKQLPDLCLMKDLNKAALRIIDALEKNEKIGIYGDYDVDGTTSCALLYHFFQMLGKEVNLVQPSRFVEGYGIHPPNIDAAIEKGIKVLITVDCGITANEAAQRALELGLDLIITDHHKDAREEMPRAFALVNPNRRDENLQSPLCALAGVGVAFSLALEIKKIQESKGEKIPTLYPLLQFVAIGTLCDMAQLTPVNLKLVRHGLKQMAQSDYPGIRAFFTPEERKLGKVLSEKCGFYIGPMINSKGRLEHPEKALELLISKNSDQAFLCYNQLDICNRERKIIQSQVFEGARDQALRDLQNESPLISIVYNPEWHEGVVGIVASKLVDTFKIPALVFTNSEEAGIIKGSARSAGDLNIFDLLQELSPLFIKFGGHKAAAGLSMKKENLPEFTLQMKKLLAKIPAVIRTETDVFDMDITSQDLGPKLARDLELLEPYGNANEKPRFRVKDLKVDSYELMRDVHVRWNMVSKNNPNLRFKGVSFNYIGKWDALHPEEIFKASQNSNSTSNIEFELGINRWNGKEFVQLQIQKITMM